MTIHHDKLAYGKLAKTSEELSEEQILKMLKDLNGDEPQDGGEDKKDDARSRGKKPPKTRVER